MVAIMSNLLLVKLGGIKNVFLNVYKARPQNFSISKHPSIQQYLIVGIWNAIGVGFFAPPFMQRMLMNKSTKKVQTMFLLGGVLTTLLFLAFLLIGFSSSILYPNISGSDIIPHLINHHFPLAMKGIFLTGILAMNMSTSDSFLNAGGLVLVHDVIKPLCDKKNIKINELRQTRFFTFIIGSLTVILAAFASTKTLPVAHLFWYGNLVFSASFVPLASGIMGLKLHRKSFLLAFASSLIILIPAKILGKNEDTMDILALLVNAIVLFTSHFIINKGLVTVNRSTQVKKKWVPSMDQFLEWLKAYFPIPQNMARYSFLKVSQHGHYPLTFSIFLCASYLFPYIITKSGHLHLYNDIAIIRAIGVILCIGLMLKSLWPQKLKHKVFPLYWHFTLLYCLPFSTTLIFLIGAGSTSWPADIAMAILLLILLVDWLSFFIIGLLGIAAGTMAFVFLYDKTPTIPDFDTAYYLITTSLATITIGIIFARKKEVFAFVRFKTITTLARFIGREVSYFANYTLSPSQAIKRDLKYKAKKIDSQEKEGEEIYCIDKGTYENLYDHANTIEKRTKHMVETSKQLGSLIKQYAESLNNPTEIAMGLLAQRAIQSYPGEEEQRKRIKLEVKRDFVARVPARALTFVIHNIIRNAYVHGGADVEVCVTVDDQRLSIRNNGKSIPPEYQDKIFQIFFTTGDERFSTGIGLGFAKMVVEWFMGSINCESSNPDEKESYVNFTIQFPIHTATEEENDKEKIRLIVQNLIKEGLDMEKIQNLTHLSKEEIEEVKSSMGL